MIVFPNAKINIGLNIIEKRADGYHNIESILYPIPWKDILEIIPSNKFKFSYSGLPVEGELNNNLCVSAYNLLKDAYNIDPIAMHLHKLIPMGAGLGGGSSDGAFTLKLIDQIFELNIGHEKLKDFAAELGSDCPFFIDNLPALATGTGTQTETISLDLTGKYIVVVYPGIHISTIEAYNGVSPSRSRQPLKDLTSRSLNTWKDIVKNDFEKSILVSYPEIKDIKNNLFDQGSFYASLSGSGSAVYGIFDTEPVIKDFGSYNILTDKLTHF